VESASGELADGAEWLEHAEIGMSNAAVHAAASNGFLPRISVLLKDQNPSNISICDYPALRLGTTNNHRTAHISETTGQSHHSS
jgi:hypothetical protein